MFELGWRASCATFPFTVPDLEHQNADPARPLFFGWPSAPATTWCPAMIPRFFLNPRPCALAVRFRMLSPLFCPLSASTVNNPSIAAHRLVGFDLLGSAMAA